MSGPVSQTASYIVTRGYRHASLITSGATPSAAQMAEGIAILNDIVNLFATQGLKLWLQEELTLPLVQGQYRYALGPGGDLNIVKPLSVFQAFYLYATSQTRQPVILISRDEWSRLSQINVQGAISSVFIDKQQSFVYVNTFNVPDALTATGTLQLVSRVYPNNSTISTDTVGFPPEWYLALEWMLADDLADSMPQEVQDRCTKRAAAYRETLEGWDTEDAPTMFQPDQRSMYYANRFR